MAEKTTFATIDDYIAAQPEAVRPLLVKLRKVIREAAPEAEERMSWQMPTFWQKHNLVHFAAQKHHIGFYPTPEAIVTFAEELKEYKTTKGGVQLPLSKPIPYELVGKITRWRVEKETGAEAEVEVGK
ncbi:MAG: iron chaperone [Oscillospiraceae bacterium]